MNTDFRIRNMQAAIDRAEGFEAMAALGGDALTDTEGYMKKAARSRRHAAWIEAKIAAHPFSAA